MAAQEVDGPGTPDVPAQGDLPLLHDPVALELLTSREWARMASTWHDGTPRVVPVAFHRAGTQLVVGTQPHAPEVAALREHPRVAVTIDTNGFPAEVLLVRGEASVEVLDDTSPEYAESMRRCIGTSAGTGWPGGPGSRWRG